MAPDVEAARALVELDAGGEALLRSRARPIVLAAAPRRRARRRRGRAARRASSA